MKSKAERLVEELELKDATIKRVAEVVLNTINSERLAPVHIPIMIEFCGVLLTLFSDDDLYEDLRLAKVSLTDWFLVSGLQPRSIEGQGLVLQAISDAELVAISPQQDVAKWREARARALALRDPTTDACKRLAEGLE